MENRRISEALNSRSKYTYDNGVLKNNLGITNQNELEEIEVSLSFLRLQKMKTSGLKFSFEYQYYLELHKYIFQDVYPFAGQIRQENITKGNTPFCRPEFVLNCLSDLLNQTKNKITSIKTKEDYIKYLSYFYSEMNIIHPFREGNGRTLREYLRQLVEYLNDLLPLPAMILDYSNITEEARAYLMKGSILSSMTGKTELLEKFFSSVLKEKTLENEKDKLM